MDEIRRLVGLGRSAAYQKAVERVREMIIQLAPEVAQDWAEPWRGALHGIEAAQVIQQVENSAVGRSGPR